MTPRRTASRPRLAVLVVLALFLALLGPGVASAAEPPDLSGDNAILIETTTGDVAHGLRPDERRPIASATKLMTALITLERTRLSQVMPASGYRPAPIESQLGLTPGEELTVADLLRALLLESANDAAVTLAEGTAGSRPAFVRAMNQRARELGLEQTSFANPIGLDAPENHSSARDLAELTLALQDYPFFVRTVARERVTLRSGDRVRTVENRNSLVAHQRVDGVKTGHTQQAEYVLVGSGESRRGIRLISVVLGAPSEEARNEDTLELLTWGFGLYRTVRPVRRGDSVDTSVDIRYRRGAELPLMAARGVERVIRRDDAAPETRLVGVPSVVEGPVRRGQRIGDAAIVVLEDGREVTRVPLVAAVGVPEAGPGQRLKDALTRPLVLVLLAVGLVGTVAIGRTLLRRRSRPSRPAGGIPRSA